VSTRIVIGRDGLVKGVSDSGSTLPDPELISCVQKVFSAICFDRPEAGMALVIYPLKFGP
jgi:Ca-activated chloride channel family protein